METSADTLSTSEPMPTDALLESGLSLMHTLSLLNLDLLPSLLDLLDAMPSSPGLRELALLASKDTTLRLTPTEDGLLYSMITLIIYYKCSLLLFDQECVPASFTEFD